MRQFSNIAGIELKDAFASLSWAIIHVYLLVGFQHCAQVLLHWLWRCLTYQRRARMITVDRRPFREERSGQTSVADPADRSNPQG